MCGTEKHSIYRFEKYDYYCIFEWILDLLLTPQKIHSEILIKFFHKIKGYDQFYYIKIYSHLRQLTLQIQLKIIKKTKKTWIFNNLIISLYPIYTNNNGIFNYQNATKEPNILCLLKLEGNDRLRCIQKINYGSNTYCVMSFFNVL